MLTKMGEGFADDILRRYSFRILLRKLCPVLLVCANGVLEGRWGILSPGKLNRNLIEFQLERDQRRSGILCPLRDDRESLHVL